MTNERPPSLLLRLLHSRLKWPLLLGALLATPGIWLLTSWQSLSLLLKILALLLTFVGGGMILLVTTLICLLLLLHYFFRSLRNDFKSLAYSLSYMLNMGRPPLPPDPQQLKSAQHDQET